MVVTPICNPWLSCRGLQIGVSTVLQIGVVSTSLFQGVLEKEAEDHMSP